MSYLSKEEVATLNLLLDENATLAEVSGMLRRPASAITIFLTHCGRLFNRNGQLYLIPTEPWMTWQEMKRQQEALKKLGQGVTDEFPNYGKTWTKEDEVTLVRLFLAKESVDDIAKALGRPSTAIAGRLEIKGHLVKGRNYEYYLVPEKPWASSTQAVGSVIYPASIKGCQVEIEDILRERCAKMDSIDLADLMMAINQQVLRAYYLGARGISPPDGTDPANPSPESLHDHPAS